MEGEGYDVPQTTDPSAGLVELAASRPPTAGRCRVIAIDGRSGSGKTLLAGAVGRHLTASGCDWTGVALDDVYPGWDGLAAGSAALAEALTAWREDRPAAWPSWNWIEDRSGPVRFVPPSPFLVVEGVGTGARSCRAGLTVLTWVQAPTAVRRARAIARDGEAYLPHWDRWAGQEDAYLREHDPRPGCDLEVSADELEQFLDRGGSRLDGQR